MVPESASPDPVVKTVFIVGFPRSGTTWLSWLLAQHPAVVAFQHGWLFRKLKGVSDWWRMASESGTDIVGTSIVGTDIVELGDTPNQRVSLGAALPPGDFRAACRPLAQEVYSRIAEVQEGVRVVVEQTPENLVLADFVHGVLPDAYFLHLVRDPRSVLSSLRKAVDSWADPGGFPTSAVDFARLWCEYIERGQALAQLTDRVLEVRYEQLLAEGEHELARIFSWLDLPHDANLRARAVEACTLDKLRQKASAPSGFFRKGSADAWRQEISRSQLRTVEYIAGSQMTRLGYELALPPARRPPFRMRWGKLSSRVVKWIVAGPLRPIIGRVAPLLRRFARLGQGMASSSGAEMGTTPPTSSAARRRK